jgi:hypothetical protein
LVRFTMNRIFFFYLLLEVPKHDAKPIAWSPLWPIFFSCCKIQTWAHVSFYCPCVCSWRGTNKMFFIIIGYKQMGLKPSFAPLIIVISIFIMGLNFVHLFLCFFCCKIQTRWGFVNGQVAFNHNLNLKGRCCSLNLM